MDHQHHHHQPLDRDDDIAIASVTASVRNSAGREGKAGKVEGEGGGGGGGSTEDDEGANGGLLVDRFESLHQRVANAAKGGGGPASSSSSSSSSRGSSLFASRPWLVPLLWGCVSGGAVLGLGIYFRPKAWVAQPGEGEGEGGEQGGGGARPGKVALLRAAAWVGGAFLLSATAAAAQQRFGKGRR